MHEVESLSDRVAVLRHGCFEGDIATKDTNAEDMTNRMVGHKVTLNIERPEPVNPKPRLEVKGLTVKTEDGIVKLKDVSFTARSGEIGYRRNFRLWSEGASGSDCGTSVHHCGKHTYIEENGTREELVGRDPREIMDMGVSLSFVPEDVWAWALWEIWTLPTI